MGSTADTTPRPLRLGVIGTGLAVEKLHWPALKRMADHFQIVAFANHTRPKAEEFAAYAGASMDEYHADYHDLLRRDDVEAVLISLPIPLNLPATRASLEAGKHVICEKPTGRDLEEVRAFLGLPARFPDRKVLIAENFFYRDSLRLARSLIDAGAIGRPHLLSWRRMSHQVPRAGEFSGTPWRIEPQYVGGPHLDGGVHHIAQMRLLCGEVGQVYGAAEDANPTMGGPSDLTLTLRFVGGTVGSYTAGDSAIPLPPEDNEMRLYGTEATMLVAPQRIRLHRADGTIEDHRIEGSDGGYYNEFLNFYDAVVHDEPVVGDIAQSFQNMQVMLRGLESAASGQVLPIDSVPGGAVGAVVPFWRPRRAEVSFDGLPVQVIVETPQP